MTRRTATTPVHVAAAALAALLAQPLPAQAPEGEERPIVIEGKRESVRKSLERLIAESESGQLARYEKDICPAVAGLPADWTAVVTRMIRDNVVAAGRRAAAAGCQVNALAIVVDRPRDMLIGLRKSDPSFFAMTPRTFDHFVAAERPAYSWQLTDTFGSRGEMLRQLSTLTYRDPNTGAIITTPLDAGTKLAKAETGSRLTSGVREEIELSFVAVDRDRIEGLTLRQLADFATMHLLLQIRPDAGAQDPGSILSLFEPREGEAPPARMSRFDRGALGGLYGQPHNNRSAAQQRQNIVKAIERGAGEQQMR